MSNAQKREKYGRGGQKIAEKSVARKVAPFENLVAVWRFELLVTLNASNMEKICNIAYVDSGTGYP